MLVATVIKFKDKPLNFNGPHGGAGGRLLIFNKLNLLKILSSAEIKKILYMVL